MFKKALLALAMTGVLGSASSSDAQAGYPVYIVRRPVLRALAYPTVVTPVPTWGYRYTPPSYGWSFRPATGWGFYQSGGTYGWGFGY